MARPNPFDHPALNPQWPEPQPPAPPGSLIIEPGPTPDAPPLGVLELHPGDTLILTTKHMLSNEDWETLRSRWRASAPDVNLAILEGGLDIAAVSRAGAETPKVPGSSGDPGEEGGAQDG